MQKKRTRARRPSLFRQVLAMFLAFTTLWLLWLTADLDAAMGAVESIFPQPEEGPQLSAFHRLVLAQSSLLSATPIAPAENPEDAAETHEPVESFLPSTAPTPSPEVSPEAVTTTAPDSIIGRTMVPGSSSRYVSADGLYIYNYTDYQLDIPQLLSSLSPWELAQEEGPHVLIYHSHTTEGYTMDGTDIYEESDAWRTTDPNYNMIRIGEEMKEVLEAAGLQVIHDDTLYDYPNYSGAYDRSAKGVTAILEEYPTIRLVLDVHRDALEGSDGTVYKTVSGTDPNSAQIMMVVGSDAGGQKHSGWRKNLALALTLQEDLLARHGTLVRPIVLRSSRFNQQLCPGSLLVEVGSHGNTLQEAITAARLFAQQVAETLT